ncbi:hypothetical protein [Ferrovibrio terrae]|uniref:hypothetical protein n=1 Tax=Ferrovibrio terrae TaxID=2594003 RepID=UPI0031376ED7
MVGAFGWIKRILGAEDDPDSAASPSRLQSKQTLSKAGLPPRLQASNLQVVGLQAIRDTLADQWQERRDKINQIVDSAIRRRLEPGDAHFHLDNDDYLVLFLHLTHAQAKAKAAMIADELRRLILGEVPGADIHVTSRVAEIDRDFVTSKIDSIHELVDHVQQTGQSSQGDVMLFDDDPGEPFEDFSQAVAPQAAVPVTGAGPDLADLDQSLTALFQKKKSASFLKECQAAFYPNFSTRRRAFSFYTVAVSHVPTGRPADSSDPMLEDPEELEFLLDRYRLTTALLGMHRMVTGGHQGVIIIPVSFQTLATSKNRGLYLSRFRDLPRGLFRSLCITLCNIPPGTPASRVADAMNYLQPFCASRLIKIPADPKLIDLYAGSGVHGFETSLPVEAADSGTQNALLANFAKRAAWHKLESLLSNIGTPDDLRTGSQVGFNFLIGDAVAPLIATPGHRQALRADHIPQRSVTVTPG